MTGLKIICPICTDEFKADDEIYVTSCGHLYHYACMRQWQSRSTSCPQCREHNPTNHKVYLNIEDVTETPTAPPVDEDLHAKLESSIDKIHELQAQLQESELNFFHIQEQYTNEQDIRKQMEQRIDQFNDSESNFLHLHAQYSESDDRLKLQKEEIDRLVIENEFKAKELEIRSTEISTLKESLAANQNVSSDTVLKTKIIILEQKLKHVTGELEKQISNCTQLAIDKIKLQSYIQRMEMHTNARIAPDNAKTTRLQTNRFEDKNPNISNNSPVVTNVPPHRQGSLEQKSKNIFHETPGAASSASEQEYSLGNISTGSDVERKLNSSSVMLNSFPLNKISGSLQDAIISIAAQMDIFLTHGDIVKVNIMNRGGMRKILPNDVNIYVQFITEDFKLKFISNRGLLRKDVIFGKVNIKEFIDEKVHAIFMYANRKLRGTVFSYIVCINNTIIAKKQRSDVSGIVIESTQMVDELLTAHLQPKVPPIYEEADRVDESYYKIEI